MYFFVEPLMAVKLPPTRRWLPAMISVLTLAVADEANPGTTAPVVVLTAAMLVAGVPLTAVKAPPR